MQFVAMNFASKARMIYARSARKSSRSDQALDTPPDRHETSGNTSDPLSQVFSLLNVRAARCTRFEAGGNWSYRFPAKPALKFGAVIRGDCWIDFGDEAHHRLVTGDCFLLANAPAYVLANDQRLAPEDGIAAFSYRRAARRPPSFIPRLGFSTLKSGGRESERPYSPTGLPTSCSSRCSARRWIRVPARVLDGSTRWSMPGSARPSG